ncbi:MAG: hypothetical protein R2761_10355 [Acidimicrobiales bacterium]
MADPTSADPDALGRFVDTSGRLRGELQERSAELDALVRWVESGSPDSGVVGMAGLVDRLAALAVQWELSEAGVAGMRDALVGADAISETTLPPLVDGASLVALARNRVADDLAADLVRAGLTEALAGVIAAETVRLVAADPSLTVYAALRRASASSTGVSEAELDRRARAFGLPRSAVAAVVLENLSEVERASGGYGHGVALAGLRDVADHEGTPRELRDAAYRLASDPGLFNDLDSAARTKGVTPTGYDWSQIDGVIGRSDLEGFARQDGQIRTVLPWRLLLDTAADGFRLAGADGIVRAMDVERFVHDRRVPEAVRRAAWDLYADTDPDLVRGIEPFDPSRSDGGDQPGGRLADTAGRALLGPMVGRGSSWLAAGRGLSLGTGEAPVPSPASGGSGSGGSSGAGFGGLVAAVVATALEPVLDAGVDRGISAWDRLRAAGMPTSFVVFDPVTGQPVALDAGPLAGLSGDDAVAAVFWAAATGRAPAEGVAAHPIPDGVWVDELGVWRDGTTNRPLGGEPSWAAAGGTKPLAVHRAGGVIDRSGPVRLADLVLSDEELVESLSPTPGGRSWPRAVGPGSRRRSSVPLAPPPPPCGSSSVECDRVVELVEAEPPTLGVASVVPIVEHHPAGLPGGQGERAGELGAGVAAGRDRVNPRVQPADLPRDPVVLALHLELGVQRRLPVDHDADGHGVVGEALIRQPQLHLARVGLGLQLAHRRARGDGEAGRGGGTWRSGGARRRRGGRLACGRRRDARRRSLAGSRRLGRAHILTAGGGQEEAQRHYGQGRSAHDPIEPSPPDHHPTTNRTDGDPGLRPEPDRPPAVTAHRTGRVNAVRRARPHRDPRPGGHRRSGVITPM